MSFAIFKQSPWKNSHRIYKESSLAISPAPEYASSEVLLASLYRTIGFKNVSEGDVPQSGRDLDKRIQRLRDRKQKPDLATVDADTWQSILHGVLESPKLPNQSSKRFLQVSPIVPATSLFSGSARLSSNSWPAGTLVRRMICLGSRTFDDAQILWAELFEALDVTADDDVFARWLQQETVTWTASPETWKLAPISSDEAAGTQIADYDHIQFPAKQFVKDIRSIIRSKNAVSRRQWTTLLESILRLATVSHVIWLCDVHARISNYLRTGLTNDDLPKNENIRSEIFPDRLSYMTYGDRALPNIRDRASTYLLARIGINALLWGLDEIGAAYTGALSSSGDILDLRQHIFANRGRLVAANVLTSISEVQEREGRVLLCKKGIGSNLLEFSRHVLGQRQTANALLRGYDQGFVLKKKGASSSSPWVVSLGPVSVLGLVQCALSGMSGPRSIHRLGQHLASYGITVDRHEIARNELGHQLRMLGLVLDSPDAESGMLLLPPFPNNQMAAEGHAQ